MKKIFALTVISTALLFSQESFATTFVNIDDFSVGIQSLNDITPDNVGVTGSAGPRTITNNLLNASAPIGNTLDVTGGPTGFLDITNGGGEDSEVTILWNLASGLVPANAINIGFYFAILQSDGNPTSLDFSFSSNPLASFSIPGNTANQNVSFGLSAAQIALVSAGGPLELKINGAAGWDLSVDAFGFSYDQPTTPPTNNVPEPAAFALIALGLAGLGFRKKKQA